MASFDGGSELKSLEVTEVPAGSTAVLNCQSNDFNHNFMFWLFDKNKVIGPGNAFDERKYKYEVLSGKLLIDVSIVIASNRFSIHLLQNNKSCANWGVPIRYQKNSDILFSLV